MTQRDRILLAVFATAALLAGFWFGVLKPKQAEVAELDTQLASQVERRDSALALVATGDDARRRYKRDYATVARLGKAVPPDEQTPSLVFALESTASDHDIDMSSLNLAGEAAEGAAVGAAGFPTVPVTFTVKGDFFDMERFLAAIERYTTTTGSGEGIAVRGRLITIDSVSLKPRDGAESSVEASVKATAYMLPKDEGLTNGATPAGPAGAATGTTPAGGTPPTGQPSSTPTTTASIRGVK